MNRARALDNIFLHKNGPALSEQVFSHMSPIDCVDLNNYLKAIDRKSENSDFIRDLYKKLNNKQSRQYWRVRINQLKFRVENYAAKIKILTKNFSSNFWSKIESLDRNLNFEEKKCKFW